MIPILYDSKETEFNGCGIGFLRDCTECVVTEERNGIFECRFKYPISGQFYSEISVDRIIKAKANETSELQLFRIYRSTKPINGVVNFYAQHISYDLNMNIVKPFKLSSVSAAGALNGVLSQCYYSHNFTAVSSLSTISGIDIKIPTPARKCLGGMEGSILDNYGGEYEFDNFTVRLHAQRGTDNGATILYGKNLTDVNAETNISSTYTSVYPFATDTDGNLYELPEKVIELDSASNYGESRTLALDLSEKFSEDSEITETKIRNYTQSYIRNNDIDNIKQNIEISFAQLWQSNDYEQYALLERVSLCDTVTVKYAALGVSVKAKVIKTVYDTLAEHYEKIEIGNVKSNFANTIAKASSSIQEMANAISNQKSVMQKAIDNATDIITGQKGGYIMLNPSEYPQEILIMNAPSIETATKMWRFNLGGLGYSSNGYNGPFNTAITMDGAIVADFITTGTLNADLIKAGTIQDADRNMSINMNNGQITIDSDNDGKLHIWRSGVTLYHDADDTVATSMFLSTGNEGVLTAERIMIGKRDSERTRIYNDTSGNGNILTDKISADTVRATNTVKANTVSADEITIDSDNDGKLHIWRSGVTQYNTNGDVCASMYLSSSNQGVLTANNIYIGKDGATRPQLYPDSSGTYLKSTATYQSRGFSVCNNNDVEKGAFYLTAQDKSYLKSNAVDSDTVSADTVSTNKIIIDGLECALKAVAIDGTVVMVLAAK